MTKLYLVRHGETEWNHSRRAQGQADIDLNTTGRRQAVATAKELASANIVAVYASDLKRASDTAKPIAEVHGLEVQTDPRLREIDQGEWEGLSVDEIKQRWPDMWGPARHYSTRPGGESPMEVRKRAIAAIEDIAAKHPDGGVVIVSHGGTIRWISAETLGYDDKRSARIRGLGNGAVVCIDASLSGGSLSLENLNRHDGNTTDLDDPND